MSAGNQLLTAKNITKAFGKAVIALSDVRFELHRGEIHALLGENGAGKSTLIKVLTGVEIKDQGIIELEGRQINPRSTQEAQNEGISTVYQEVNLCPNLSVAENIYIGREPKNRFGTINWKKINADASKLLEKFDLHINVTKNLDHYSVAIQQMVAIARASDIEAKVLILDEPTSSLSSAEVEKLFQIMKKLREEGMGIIFVTHFLDQVYEVTDRITVLRNGTYVGTYLTRDLPKVELVGKMIGKDYAGLKESMSTRQPEDAEHHGNEIFIQLVNASSPGTIKDFGLKVKKGEVLGFSGLLGSGRSETARVLFGIDPISEGEIKVKNNTIQLHSPLDAIRNGIAFCPENRKTEGIIGELSIWENIILALQVKKGLFYKISRKEAEELAMDYIEKLQIKTPGTGQLIKNLSGGNQQKVILARWLATEPDFLMLDEPTRGIDIGTKAEIQKIVMELAGRGMAVLFISSEIDEMLRCCTRMVILRDMKQVGELKGKEISEEAIMRIMAGGEAS
ncbi:sugar ABC transporter ATP-binding protein [Lacrimispora saccharolytica]|uniref:ABC transporter related protein n=1 Tax=Lacrimispora saccharolytica (strain ATCC 35040 / DSM 2544 / NRCC 2533 / WM1) TaxID=610130 RepID=D9R3A8_LACSW|nr:sugar ABC transporter ATP-binding protein [Lacrimispora saccharolytica]ADL04857.1 ABC transporter related protein [[Clostridium] saccharolyticum WM1]QRV20935.1 sugar ABC transporter ATP-binding protein [Lacrimispora saccharolytica]